jgi:DNA-binding CsgD family transcriptional regulator
MNEVAFPQTARCVHRSAEAAESAEDGAVLMLDALAGAALIFGFPDQRQRATPTYQRWISEAHAGVSIAWGAEELARELWTWTRIGARHRTSSKERRVESPEGLYRLVAVVVPHALAGLGPGVVVVIHPPPHEPLAEHALRARFGLTSAQARVAKLLAEGEANKAIAERLFISPHTVRHHIEQVLSRLGVASRSAATSRLLRLDARAPVPRVRV